MEGRVGDDRVVARHIRAERRHVGPVEAGARIGDVHPRRVQRPGIGLVEVDLRDPGQRSSAACASQPQPAPRSATRPFSRASQRVGQPPAARIGGVGREHARRGEHSLGVALRRRRIAQAATAGGRTSGRFSQTVRPCAFTKASSTGIAARHLPDDNPSMPSVRAPSMRPARRRVRAPRGPGDEAERLGARPRQHRRSPARPGRHRAPTTSTPLARARRGRAGSGCSARSRPRGSDIDPAARLGVQHENRPGLGHRQRAGGQCQRQAVGMGHGRRARGRRYSFSIVHCSGCWFRRA